MGVYAASRPTPSLLRQRFLRFCLVSALAAEAAHAAIEPAGLPVLKSIAEVQVLSPELARSNCPVRLTATVLYCDVEWRLLFIQDETSVTFIFADTLSVEPKSGDAIELQALTAEKDGGVFLSKPAARILGKGSLPEPKKMTAADLKNAGGAWVEIEGVVQSVDDTSRRLLMTAYGQGGRFLAVVKDYSQATFRNLVDARIQLRGVSCAPQRPGEPWQVFVPSMADVKVLHPALESPFSLPVTAAADAPDASSPDYDGHRIRIRGTVVRQQLGKSLELTEADGASIELRAPQLTPVTVGERVEVVGFPRRTESRLLLENALFRSVEDEAQAGAPADGDAGSAASAPRPAPLRRADQVRQLSPEQAAQGLPVRIDAVVTFHEPDDDILYVQDETGGLRVRLDRNGKRQPIAPAQRVEITGVSEAGTPIPQILARRIVNLGEHLLPPAHPTSWDRLSSGQEDCEWVELRGTVRAVAGGSARIQLNLATARDRCQMEVLNNDAERVPANLVGAVIRAHGVCRAVLDDRDRLRGLRLLVPWLEEIKVEEPAPADPFTLPLRPIASLYALGSQESAGRRIHLQGQVTLHKAGQFFYMQDGSAAVRVDWTTARSLQPGERVDIVGYEAEEGLLPVVEEAQVRRLAPMPLAPPQNTTARQIFESGQHGQRIAIEARLLDQLETPEGTMFVLQADDLVFNAHVVGAPAAVARRWEPGSTLRLSGVCVLAMRDWRGVQAFRLLLGSADDIELLTRPPRWTLERLGRMLGGALVVLLAVAIWAASLSRKNARLCEEIRERERVEEALRQARDQMEERVAERTADLTAANASLQEQVAERQRAQAELAYQEHLLDELLETSADLICFKDRESRFIRCSRSMARRFGADHQTEVVGKTDFDFYSEEHARPAFKDEQGILHTGEPIIGRLERETWPDGRETWVLTNKLPLRDKQGQIVGTFGISREITELRRAQEELRAARDEALEQSRELTEANARLEREIQERTEAQAKLAEVHQEMMVVSREAGMAEIATGVLHNVGNVLNSVNVSGGLITEGLKRSKVSGLSRLTALFREHADDLGALFTKDPRGRRIPSYLDQLAQHLNCERDRLLAEMTSLLKNLEHIKQIVARQQNYARATGVLERSPAVELVEDALSVHSDAFARHDIRLVREYRDAPFVLVDKHKVLQILINLLSNAKRACDDGAVSSKEVVVRVALNDRGRLSIEVADNGIGIPSENLSRIFHHGFTTRPGGHGFGLHSSALAANEQGGSLQARSAGPGQGATFTLTLPAAEAQEPAIPNHTAFLRRQQRPPSA